MAFTTFDSELETLERDDRPNEWSQPSAGDAPRASAMRFLRRHRSWWLTPFIVVISAFGLLSMLAGDGQVSGESRQHLLDQGRAIALQPVATQPERLVQH